MDQQADVCMCVCMCFQVLTRLGGYTISSRIKKIKVLGGRLRRICPIYSSWGAKKIRVQDADKSVDRCYQQDVRMGFRICILEYVRNSSITARGAPLNDQIPFVLNLSVLPQPNAAPRKSCQRCCKWTSSSTLVTTRLYYGRTE